MPIQLSYTKETYSMGDFRQLIERRVRKHIRNTHMIDLEKSYLLLDDGSPFVRLAETLLRAIFSDRLDMKCSTKEESGSLTLYPYVLEQVVSAELDSFLSDGSFVVNNCPLAVVSVEDANHLLGTSESQQDWLHPLLYDIEQKQAGTVFSLLSSFNEIIKK